MGLPRGRRTPWALQSRKFPSVEVGQTDWIKSRRESVLRRSEEQKIQLGDRGEASREAGQGTGHARGMGGERWQREPRSRLTPTSDARGNLCLCRWRPETGMGRDGGPPAGGAIHREGRGGSGARERRQAVEHPGRDESWSGGPPRSPRTWACSSSPGASGTPGFRGRTAPLQARACDSLLRSELGHPLGPPQGTSWHPLRGSQFWSHGLHPLPSRTGL